MNHFDEDILVEEVIETDSTDTGDASKIIVYNDDHNTFEWVIESFIKVLKHTAEQAEQLSYIIHYKGKANVKEGSLKELRKYKDALVERGLAAVIEK